MNLVSVVRSHQRLIDPSAFRFPSQSISWNDVARLCRRICLLRERQQLAAAEELRRGPLAEALAALRPTTVSETALEEKLDSLFAAEAERVANAAVLAELLAPLLAPKLQSGAPTTPHASLADDPALATATPLPPTEPQPPRDPTDIAHFIDEMIAQERPAPRPAPARYVS